MESYGLAVWSSVDCSVGVAFSQTIAESYAVRGRAPVDESTTRRAYTCQVNSLTKDGCPSAPC
jgi:hypothetical protein